MDVPQYQKKISEDSDNKPWWSGELTNLNGYFFIEDGGNFCYTDDLGVTAAIQPLIQGANGQAQNADEIAAVIICPESFDGSPRPNSYKNANNLLADGTNLADGVPKSVTLVHELFHALRGTAFVRRGEEYDIATCLELANKQPGLAQINPENYVFFIAHIYHVLGDDEGDEPWSIQKNWDFHFTGKGKNRIYSAFEYRA